MFNKILVPVDIDYPKTAAIVYQKALDLAESTGSEIRLVSVMPGYSMPIVASFISEEMVKKAKDQLRANLETFIQDNCKEPITYTIKTGKNWEEIVKAADKWEADLIVVYHNRRRDENEVFSNSCSQRVTENANCSVLRLRNIRA
jgi:universal stress protein F